MCNTPIANLLAFPHHATPLPVPGHPHFLCLLPFPFFPDAALSSAALPAATEAILMVSAAVAVSQAAAPDLPWHMVLQALLGTPCPQCINAARLVNPGLILLVKMEAGGCGVGVLREGHP